MQRWNGFAVKDDASGEHVAAASIDVFDPGTTTALTGGIFSDDGVTPKANPFTADANGYGFFYARSGLVDIRFSGTGISAPYTLPDVLLWDPTDGPDRWENLYIPVTAMKDRQNAVPDFQQLLATGLFTYLFDSAADQELYWSAVLPAAYKSEADISVYAHWAPTTAAVNNVAWEVGHSWANAGSVLASVATVAAQPATPGQASEAVTTLLGTITGTSKLMDSLLSGYVRRDADHASDDYPVDAALFGISLRFLVDTLGSAAALTK